MTAIFLNAANLRTKLDSSDGSSLFRLYDSSSSVVMFIDSDGITCFSKEVGIGNSTPRETLEVSGAVILGDADNTNDGTIRFTGSDFEGRQAGAWESLTLRTEELTLEGLGDTNIPLLSDEDMLVWDSSESEWTAEASATLAYTKSEADATLEAYTFSKAEINTTLEAYTYTTSEINATIEAALAAVSIEDLQSVASMVPAVNEVLTWDGSEWNCDSSPQTGTSCISLFSAYNSATTNVVGATVEIPFQTVVKSDPEFSFSGNTTLKFLNTGWYRLTYNMDIIISAGGSRSQFDCWFFNASDSQEIPGTRSTIYGRTTNYGSEASCTTMFMARENQEITVQSIRTAGSDTGRTNVNTCRFTAERISAEVMTTIAPMEDIADVNLAGLQDGYRLTWNNGAGEWQPSLTGQPDQNLFYTIEADVGSAAPSTSTDTLTFEGGTNITTEVTGTTLTVSELDGVFGNFNELVRQYDTGFDEDLVFGSPQMDDDGNAAHDSRFFFDEAAGSFRAGIVTGSQWDSANRGSHSAAFGYNTEASGDYSFACGNQATASGDYSFASGAYTTASGDYSGALGYGCTSSGLACFSVGWSSEAQADYSYSFGKNNIANGFSAIAFGMYTTSEGSVSTSFGNYNSVSGDYSIAMGSSLEITGNYSMGINLDGTQRTLAQSNTLAIMGGKLGIGVTGPAEVLEIDGTMECVACVQTSDERLKTEIRPLEYGYQEVKELNPVRFEYCSPLPEGMRIGLIAQEVQEIIPEAVSCKNDSMGTLRINYLSLVPVLVNSIREQEIILKDLEAELESLVGEVE